MVPERVLKRRQEWADGDAKRDAGLTEPNGLIIHRNIEYSYAEGEHLLLDVYKPETSTGLLPTIVSIHGGGYFYGDKELYRFYCMNLAKRGFAVVNFNYRLSPEHHFPAPLEDTNSVMTWIANQGASYGIDKDALLLIGDSAGAQLSAHYGTIYSNPSYAASLKLTVPSVRILGLSLACGLYDIKAAELEDPDLMHDYWGDQIDRDDPRLDYLSCIDANFPPTFLFTSFYDFLKEKAAPMQTLLEGRGVPVRLKLYGKEGDTYMGHVFHVDLKLSEATEANDDQASFFRSLLN